MKPLRTVEEIAAEIACNQEEITRLEFEISEQLEELTETQGELQEELEGAEEAAEDEELEDA